MSNTTKRELDGREAGERTDTAIRAQRIRWMQERDRALARRDIAEYQRLTTALANLPMKGMKALTLREITKWNGR